MSSDQKNAKVLHFLPLEIAFINCCSEIAFLSTAAVDPWHLKVEVTKIFLVVTVINRTLQYLI